jgi:hypothetical protein
MPGRGKGVLVGGPVGDNPDRPGPAINEHRLAAGRLTFPGARAGVNDA